MGKVLREEDYMEWIYRYNRVGIKQQQIEVHM